MTYPPQRPGQQGPYGQDPYGQQPGFYGQYGPQPGPYGQPGGPPPKKTGMIVTIVVIAVLVLAGSGVGIYFLTKNDDKGNSASDGNQTETNEPDQNSDPTDTTPTDSKPTGGNRGGGSKEDLLAAAKNYAATVNAADKAAATKLTCDQTGPGSLYNVTNSGGQTPGDVQVSNPTVLPNGNGTVDITLAGSSASAVPMLFQFKTDKWCVAV